MTKKVVKDYIGAVVENNGVGATVNDVTSYRLKGGLYFIAIDTTEKNPIVNWFHKDQPHNHEFIVLFRKRGQNAKTYTCVKITLTKMERPKMLVYSTKYGCYFYVVPEVVNEKQESLYINDSPEKEKEHAG